MIIGASFTSFFSKSTFVHCLLNIILTLFVFWGFKTFKIDDDLVKTFPQNMESKLIWDDIQEEFGQTEFIFVAFGRPNYCGNILDDKWAIVQSQLFTEAILKEKYLKDHFKIRWTIFFINVS